MKSAYYGSIPLPIRHHKDIKPYSKLLYAEITACLNEDGKCVHRNTHFKKVLDMGSTTLSNSLNELRKAGFIHIEIQNEKGTNKFIERYITPTPINILEGVKDNSGSTHASILDGVDANAPLKEVIAPTTMLGTLLYNNNNINKIYTDGSKSIEILDELNKKQVDYLKKIVYSFYTKKREQMPNIIKSNWVSDKNLINDSINTLYMIIKLDDYSEQIVRDVIKWAVDDSFWGNVLISLRGLRNKSKNGQSKFTNLYVNYQKGNK